MNIKYSHFFFLFIILTSNLDYKYLFKGKTMQKVFLFGLLLSGFNCVALQVEKKELCDTSNGLSTLAYKKKGEEIISAVKSIGKGLPDDIAQSLKNHVENLSKLNSGNLDLNKATKSLNPDWVFLFVMNHLKSNPGAKFLLEFAQKSNELLAHRIRRILKAYTTSLEDFESDYKQELNKVSDEEYGKLLEKIDSTTMNKILIEEASKLADYMLKNMSKL